MPSEISLVTFRLRRTGASLMFVVEPVPGGVRQFTLEGIHAQRVQWEVDALQSLVRGDIGTWTTFPVDGVQATVTRDQLRIMGFRGNF